MKNPVISLGGLIDSPELAVDMLLANYYTTLASQTIMHQGLTFSMTNDFARSSSNTTLETNITSSLDKLFEYYFNEYNITVEVTGTNDDLEVNIGVVVREGGITYDVSKFSSIVNSKVGRLSDTNVAGNI